MCLRKNYENKNYKYIEIYECNFIYKREWRKRHGCRNEVKKKLEKMKLKRGIQHFAIKYIK